MTVSAQGEFRRVIRVVLTLTVGTWSTALVNDSVVVSSVVTNEWTALPVVTLMCADARSDSEWDSVEPQSFSFSTKRNFACVENQEDMNCERTLAKAFPCPTRRVRTPLPQHSSYYTSGIRKPLERSEKNGCCKDGAVREQQIGCLKLEIHEVDSIAPWACSPRKST